MKITQRAVSSLEPAADNPRLHDERGIEAISQSIDRFGFRQPLVVRGAEVIVGNGRLEAARRLGHQRVPCVNADDLSEDEARALRAADNRVGELSGWHPDLLAADLKITPDELRIGWNPAELDGIIGEIGDVEVPVLEVAPPEPQTEGPIVSETDAEPPATVAAPAGEHAADGPPDVPPPRKGPLPELRAPFPYSGGKRRWAAEVNARLGTDCQTYVEPFAGSLAVLLSRPAARREVVCDTYSLLVNAWRAMAAAPDECAKWCDWPTFHDDLIARRRWLGAWAAEHAAKVQEDADWYDAKAGGWWIWVQSQSIGGSSDGVVFAGGHDARRMLGSEKDIPHASAGSQGVQARSGGVTDIPKGIASGVQAGRARSNNGMERAVPFVSGAQGTQAQRKVDGRIPTMDDSGSAQQGVQAQRSGRGIGGVNDRPNLNAAGPDGGRGVQAQRKARASVGQRPQATAEQGVQAHRAPASTRPSLHSKRAHSSAGVQAQRKTAPGGGNNIPVIAGHGKSCNNALQAQSPSSPAGGLPSSERWGPWFQALAARLKQVIVLNRPWQSGVTPAVLGEAGGGEIAILLDPPYVVEGRSTGLYASDSAGDASINRVAEECHAWAVEHGERYRIAYCHALGSFQFPAGWVVRAQNYPGGQSTPASRRRDAIAFSPRCIGATDGDDSRRAAAQTPGAQAGRGTHRPDCLPPPDTRRVRGRRG